MAIVQGIETKKCWNNPTANFFLGYDGGTNWGGISVPVQSGNETERRRFPFELVYALFFLHSTIVVHLKV